MSCSTTTPRGYSRRPWIRVRHKSVALPGNWNRRECALKAPSVPRFLRCAPLAERLLTGLTPACESRKLSYARYLIHTLDQQHHKARSKSSHRSRPFLDGSRAPAGLLDENGAIGSSVFLDPTDDLFGPFLKPICLDQYRRDSSFSSPQPQI